MAKKDFLASIVLIAFSLTVLVHSYTMPRLERRGIDPLSAPGVVPGFIGGVLLVLALVLFVRSIRKGGYRLRAAGGAEKTWQRGAAYRVLLTLGLSIAYAVGFLGRVNYSLATAGFIFGFICFFELAPGQERKTRIRILALALVQAVLASLAVTLVFQKLFLVDLP